jgi:hypothetical protein
MLQRGTIPTVSGTTAELSESWQESLRGEWIATLRSAARLPATPREFMIYSVGLFLIACGLALHVFLSVQILDTRVQIRQIDAEIEHIERINSEIIYATTLHTSVEQMEQRIQASGYAYTTDRLYVAHADTVDPRSTPDDQPLGKELQPASDEGSTQNALHELPQRMGELMPALPDRSRLNASIMATGDQVRNWAEQGRTSLDAQEEQLRQRFERFAQRE